MLKKINEVRSEEISEEDYSKVIQICQKLDTENTSLKNIITKISTQKPSISFYQNIQQILSQTEIPS